MNFNTPPYNDDFDIEKNHLKVLFKPNRYVQARELNTLQSILQNQVSSIGNHLFKNNSKITGCSTAFVEYSYVRLNDKYNDQDVVLGDYNHLRVAGVVSSVEASIVEVAEKDVNDPPTLFVVYTKVGSDNEQTTFIQGEDVNFIDENDVVVYTATVRCPTCPENEGVDNTPPLGKGMFFTMEEGIFYNNGFFVKTPFQHIPTEKYLTKDENGQIDSELTYRVGMDVVEQVITANDDESLFDPHMGEPNFAAEGADRFKIDLVLAIRDYVEEDDESSFITLAKVRQNHTVEYKKDDTEYGDIMKEISRRTYETSGNFTNVPWKARFLNEKKKANRKGLASESGNGTGSVLATSGLASDPQGWSTTGSDDNFVAIVSTGSGYIKGNRVENTSETVVVGRKARDTRKARGASTSFTPIQNFTITTTDDISWINHTGSSTLSDQIVNFKDDNGVSIGSFKIYDIQKLVDDKYQLYVYEINLLTGKTLSMVKSVAIDDNSLKGSIIGQIHLQNANNTSLLFPVGRESIKSMRDNDNAENGNTSLYLKRRFSGILNGEGSITFTTQSNEQFISPSMIVPICWVGSNPNGVKIDITSNKFAYTPTSLTLTLGTEHAGKNVTYISSTIRTSQQEKTKMLTRHAYTTNTSPNNAVGSEIVLPHVDGYRIDSIKLISSSDASFEQDVTSNYEFLTGQTDVFYTNAKIKVKNSFSVDSQSRLIITYYYFEHSGDEGFFTVDSYNQLINDPDLNLEYEDIPTYKATNGTVYRLAEVFDFRTIKRDNTIDQNAPIVAFDTNAVFDIEYYLDRADLLLVSAEGQFYIKEGVSSETASLPQPDPDSMLIYEIYIKAYTYDLNDISVRYIDNRKFTMKDISKITNRIDRLEKVVALNMLEMQTVNMSIKDVNGLDRYKNGFLVDNFRNFYGSDITNIEYKASLDRSMGELRPQFKSSNVRLEYFDANTSNVKRFGNVLMCDFTDDLFISNTYATKTLSINPYMVYRTHGTMTLSPNIDTWSDTSRLPTVVANIDTGVEALRQVADAADLLGVDYGTWIDLNQSITTTTNTTETTTQRTTETVRTTTTDQSRSVTTTSVGSRTQNYTIDDIIKDVSIIPYIRSQTIQFYATKLSPNTKFYAYFDGVDVTTHCKKTQQISSSGDVLVNRAQAVFGASPLISDEDGNLTGEFRIPADTFFTGEKVFVLTNDATNSGNADVETSRCEAVYFAGGVATTKQDYTMNIITPTYNVNNSSQSRSTTSVSRETTTTPIPQPVPPVVQTPVSTPETRPPMPARLSGYSSAWYWVWNNGRWVWDPIAQGFKVDESCFISKVDVFFASVDERSDVVWFEIREMVNGYPTNEGITHVEVDARTLLDYVSDDATKAYTVVFPTPVYVDSTKSYAFVVGGYSPNTRVFVSTLGDKLLNSETILEQPPLGYTMFRSLNGDTWTAYQFDTMKLNIYRCAFKSDSFNLSLVNMQNHKTDAMYAYSVHCEDNPIEVEQGVNRVRVYAKDHGLRANDQATISFDNGVYYTVEIVSGMPQIDQPASTLTGSGYVKDIRITNTLNFYEISIGGMEGYFDEGQEITFESRQYEYRDLFLISDSGASGTPITQNIASGYVRKSTDIGIPTNIANKPLSLFAKKHIVREVDSIDSFIVEIEGAFEVSGRFGGGNVYVRNSNIKFDSFNVAGQYLTYNANVSWIANTFKHAGGYEDAKEIKPQHDIYLERPSVMLSGANETRILGANKHSFKVDVHCQLTSPYVSPVFNLDSFSVTTISNRIEYLTADKYNVSPNKNARLIPETSAISGVEKFKHVSHKVLLENPATDMKIIFDVFCTSESDFDVYVKVIQAQNNVDDSTLPWIKVDDYTKKRFSNGLGDKIEYDLTLSENATEWNDDIEYIAYRVKLVGKSSNSSQPVIFENLRAIAIT